MKLLNAFTNPVINMELRLRMRSKKTPWIIAIYLLLTGGIMYTFMYFETNYNGYFNSNRSKELFMLLSFIQFSLLSFITPGLTAGVISSEREKQTLNILLTTNLSMTKIIIGKWLSSLSFMLLLIIATLPLYSIVFLFGGISPIQLAKVFGIFIISMLSIGSVGVLFSVMVKKTGVATILTYATILGYTLLVSFLPEIIRSFSLNNTVGYSTLPKWIDWIYSINPVYIMLDIFQEVNQINNLPMSPYLVFSLFFLIVTIFSLSLAIYLLKPVKKAGKFS